MRWVSLLLLLGCGDGDPYELGEPATGCKLVETKHDLRPITTGVPLGTFMAAVRE